MIRLALLLCAFCTATTAHALSCMRPSVEQAFTNANEAPDLYVPVIGAFSGFEQRKETKSPTPEDRHFQARFTGQAYTSRGKGQPLDIMVNVSELCLASWCPHLSLDTETLTFLRRDDNAYAFEINACGGNAFADPTAKQIKSLRNCLHHMECSAATD